MKCPASNPFHFSLSLFFLPGLWEVCLNGYHDMRHQYEVRFYGCKHILLEEYDIIRDELQPREYCKESKEGLERWQANFVLL